MRFFAFALALLVPMTTAAEPACGFFQYRAKIVSVHDGDTVRADIDLGFNTWRHNEPLRLYGIDAPELKEGEPGIKSRDALADRVVGKDVTLCTVKDGKEKYGRYLAKIYLGDEPINDWMVSEGLAKPYLP